MKPKLLSLTILFVLIFSSCSSVKYLSDTSNSDKKEMKSFLNNIENVAINKHYTILMEYMDIDYLKEQHEGFLEGDDLQFINEIFCGKDIIDDSFHCIKQKEITYFETKEITQIEDTKYTALFIVGNETNKVACKLLISKKVIQGKTKFGIVGAVG